MKKRGNNEGTIYQLPSHRWRAQIYINGKRLSHSFPNQKDCQAWLLEMRNRINGGSTQVDPKMTVEEYLTHWLNTVKNTRADSTWLNYESQCRLHIIPYIGQRKLWELKPIQIQELYNRLSLKNVGPPTIKKLMLFCVVL